MKNRTEKQNRKAVRECSGKMKNRTEKAEPKSSKEMQWKNEKQNRKAVRNCFPGNNPEKDA